MIILPLSQPVSIFFFYQGFLSRTFTIHRTAGEGGEYFFNSSLPLLPASQTPRHQLGDYCRELTSVHSWQPESKREPLVSERKSVTTTLRALSNGTVSNGTVTGFFLIVKKVFSALISNKTVNHLLILLSQKTQTSYKQDSSKGPDSISPGRKTNQIIMKRFLLKNYIGPVIFK